MHQQYLSHHLYVKYIINKKKVKVIVGNDNNSKNLEKNNFPQLK